MPNTKAELTRLSKKTDAQKLREARLFLIAMVVVAMTSAVLGLLAEIIILVKP